MEFRILGSLEVVGRDGIVELRGAKRRGLLACLLVNAGQPMSTDRLVEELWGDVGSDPAVRTVQTYVSQLRKLLYGEGASLATRPGGYVLEVNPRDVDAHRFERLVVTCGGDPSPARRLATVNEALAMWRGQPLDEFSGTGWADREATRLEDLHLQAQQGRCDSLMELGRAREAVAELELLASAHPLDERLWGQFMLALYRSGRQADALGAYQQARSHLVGELGIEPGPELAGLEHRILDHDPTLAIATDRTAAAGTQRVSARGGADSWYPRTFLLTDIVDSVSLWERDPEAMSQAVTQHEALIRDAVTALGGELVRTKGEGDSTFSVFPHPWDAVTAAASVQEAVASEQWPSTAPLRVRIGVHTGDAEPRGGDWYGPAVNRAARLRALAGSKQTLVSGVTAGLTADQLPRGVRLLYRGRRVLRGIERPEEVWEVVAPEDARLNAAATGGAEGLLSAAEPSGAAGTVLPAPLTSFVGRTVERAALADLVLSHRLVTAVGPGGIGKTRLALAVAGDLGPTLPAGACFVDLVPLIDPSMVADAVAVALGVREPPGGTIEDGVLAHLAERDGVLVLDNCEHLVDGVAAFVERLLAACPHMRVLATSRARLVLPFEHVFTVPGLSLTDGVASSELHGDRAAAEYGDAVALFVARAGAAGQPPFSAGELGRVAAVCRAVDGMALAIELTAARLPSLGLDGIEASLADGLGLLAGGSRLDERHRSMRAAIDWSYRLLDPADQAVLRRVSVFAAPFTANAATQVAGFPPVDVAGVFHGLARLADSSLVMVRPGAETRYRVLETVRQYGEDEAGASGESDAVAVSHLSWCQETAMALVPAAGGGDAWRAAFDRVADDLRAALVWAIERPEHRAEARTLAQTLADLTFQRSLPAESQRRYEQAGALIDDPAERIAILDDAAGAALCRYGANDAMRLWREAAEVALGAGSPVVAASRLATAALVATRGPGLFERIPARSEVDDLLREATLLAAGSPVAAPVMLAALGFCGDDDDPVTFDLAERAVDLAHRVGDPITESAALDLLCVAHLALGDIPAAVATVRRRISVLDSLPVRAVYAFDLLDGFSMASEILLAAGDILGARAFADRVAALPFVRDQARVATARRIKVDAIAGDLPGVVAAGERFRVDWDNAGRPAARALSMTALATALAHGLRGDDAASDQWRQISVDLGFTPEWLDAGDPGIEVFDAIVHLHRGDAVAALERLRRDPEGFRTWYGGEWRTWYAALWAEAAVLAGHPAASERVQRARQVAAVNPVARAMVERAAALAAGHPERLAAVAAAIEPRGCPYQWARTLALAGGEHRALGVKALAALGAAPMAIVTDSLDPSR
jgi:predicted ATPase/DNA-binding SARP family transcriptional activator